MSSHRSSEYPASGRPNIRPPFVRISGLHSSKYPASVCPNIRPPLATLTVCSSWQQPAIMMKENGDVFVDFRNVLAAARGRQVWRKI